MATSLAPLASQGAGSGWHWRAPLRPVRRRVQAWFHSRLRRTDTLTLTQRNVYILPTRAGWMLALTLLVLLVASINFQLNLGYLLTFLLAGSALVGMHVCHNNLRGLALHLHPPEAVHAHQAVVLEARFASERRRPRHGIGLGVVHDDGTPPDLAWTDVPAQGQAQLQVAWRAPGRGQHKLPTLIAQTLFPLGTFRVWALWRPAATALVYPEPEAHPPPLPPGEPQGGGAGSARVHSTGEYDGVRAYRRGDPMKAVVWKKAAQAFAAGRNELVSRDALSSQRQQLWLDLQQCGGTDFERRISRLTAWVLMADRLGLDYGLRLPGREIAPDQGPAHRARCLEALALC
ncbi:DUF58 domain-containing protein [Hydrogenophaga intermedia]|uniref:DUF58 domain-containing protein n=1 Tax=Hydrogenophaga intermedia TaxID=65786 RepID=UPI0020440F9C|nr:DUF58 domain-containing protein [Hydrogenophaga intermedia]MCM3564538.1 DUF58 domain-containing protein [Hydrogenophaga intermedia]